MARSSPWTPAPDRVIPASAWAQRLTISQTYMFQAGALNRNDKEKSS